MDSEDLYWLYLHGEPEDIEAHEHEEEFDYEPLDD